MIKNENFSLQRLTALWAFSEAALGGLLHALHIPFSGVVLGGFAIMFISLIAYYSKNHSEIFFEPVVRHSETCLRCVE